MADASPTLSRNLRNRHIQLIAIGGTIGVGLFLGSAKAIHDAGPGLLLGYAVGGVAIFFIMRALGELITYRPVAGSFAVYAEEFCGPFAGFVDRLVLLVHVGGDRDGGADSHRHLCALLVPGRTAVAARPWLRSSRCMERTNSPCGCSASSNSGSRSSRS